MLLSRRSARVAVASRRVANPSCNTKVERGASGAARRARRVTAATVSKQVAFLFTLVVLGGFCLWLMRVRWASTSHEMAEQRLETFRPPLPQPIDRCAVATSRGDAGDARGVARRAAARPCCADARALAAVHRHFESITNETHLHDALAAYENARAGDDVELRIALVKMLLLDSAGCLRAVDNVLRRDMTNEQALHYRGMCFDIAGDQASARASFDRARAAEIPHVDRFYSSAPPPPAAARRSLAF